MLFKSKTPSITKKKYSRNSRGVGGHNLKNKTSLNFTIKLSFHGLDPRKHSNNRSSIYYKTLLCIISLMPDNSLKLTSSNHRIQFTEALGTLTCCQQKILLHSRMKGLLQHGVVNELSPLLTGLTFYMNLFIGQGTIVCCPH